MLKRWIRMLLAGVHFWIERPCGWRYDSLDPPESRERCRAMGYR